MSKKKAGLSIENERRRYAQAMHGVREEKTVPTGKCICGAPCYNHNLCCSRACSRLPDHSPNWERIHHPEKSDHKAINIDLEIWIKFVELVRRVTPETPFSQKAITRTLIDIVYESDSLSPIVHPGHLVFDVLHSLVALADCQSARTEVVGTGGNHE